MPVSIIPGTAGMAALLCLLLSLLLRPTIAAYNNPHRAESSAVEPPQQVERRVVGGYSDADVNSERVVKAAQFAASSLSDEGGGKYGFSGSDLGVMVVEARQQVVAGMNYRLTLGLVDANDGLCVGAFKVSVYDHFGDMTVTNWGEEVPCGELDIAVAEKERMEEEGDADV